MRSNRRRTPSPARSGSWNSPRALATADLELISWDLAFDLARAVKSDEEMAAMRESMEIVVDGFWELVRDFEPGKTEAEIMAPAVERYFARGAGPRMMNIVLSGSGGEAEASKNGAASVSDNLRRRSESP